MNDKKLIELVRHYPQLYDMSNPKYMDTEFKMTIWSKIGEEMKKSGTLCKSRWANIRDNYRKSLKKNKIVSGQETKTVKPYKFSEQLSFLKNFFEDRDMSNIDGKEMNQDSKCSDNVSEFFVSENEENTAHVLPEVTMTVESQSLYLSNSCPTPQKKKKLSVPNTNPPKNAATTLMEYLIQRNNQHPVDAFLSGVAPVLKKLPPRYWYYVKSDIFATVQKYELQMIVEEEQREQTFPLPLSKLSQAPSPIGSYQSTSTISNPSVASPPPIANLKTENFTE